MDEGEPPKKKRKTRNSDVTEIDLSRGKVREEEYVLLDDHESLPVWITEDGFIIFEAFSPFYQRGKKNKRKEQKERPNQRFGFFLSFSF